jgi:hypothetical protein
MHPNVLIFRSAFLTFLIAQVPSTRPGLTLKLEKPGLIASKSHRHHGDDDDGCHDLRVDQHDAGLTTDQLILDVLAHESGS